MRDAAASIEVEVGVVGGPRFKAVVDPLQQENIARIITRHVVPRALLALHAAKPEVLTRCLELAADMEDRAEIIEFIAIELEEFSRREEGIESLEWRARAKLMEQESGVALLYIECYVVGDDNVGFIQDLPEVMH